ncbi:DsbA family protein, partial [Planktothrix sp. FACHB-1355]
MSKTLDVYLSFSSPFAYLANTQLTALAKRTQCNINYHVIDLYKVMQVSGNPGPKDVPAKIKYIVKDIFDWCKYYGVTINVPSRLAIDSTPGAAAALTAKDGRKLPEFIDRVMRAYFVEDLDIADAQVLGKLGAEVGLDSEVVAAA